MVIWGMVYSCFNQVLVDITGDYWGKILGVNA